MSNCQRGLALRRQQSLWGNPWPALGVPCAPARALASTAPQQPLSGGRRRTNLHMFVYR